MSRGVKHLRRRFDFFTREKVATVNDAQDVDEIKLYANRFQPACCSAGGSLIFGDEGGFIRVANSSFQITQFMSHSHRIMELQAIRGSDLLVVLGRQEIDPNTAPQCIIKIWQLSKLDEFGQPQCINRFPIFSQKYHEVVVTCMAVSEDAAHIAVGLGNGAVLTFDLSKNKKVPNRRLLQKKGDVVTGIHFLKSQNGGLSLFVVTLTEVRTYFINQARKVKVLDDQGGADMQCSYLDKERQLVVARHEAIYYYHAEERRGFDIFQGEKKMLRTYKNYLLVVTSANAKPNRSNLTVYDRKNKLIAFNRPFDDVIDIVCEWGKVYIVTKTKVDCLVEKDLDEKLNTLFNKNLYQKAIDMLLMEDPNSPKIPDYYKRYGDVLYEKHDFDGAIEQYVQTINGGNTVEPSYVIRRFLDAQRIHHLVKYLEALHDKKAASPDHTTLLLNCYTKLKNLKKLDAFFGKDSSTSESSEDRFDVATAIRVCRQAGLYEHALYLSKKHQYHDVHLSILLDSAGDAREVEDARGFYAQAIKYIAKLDFITAEKVMKTHGQCLLDHVPVETIQMLKELCTTDHADANLAKDSGLKGKKLRSKPQEFIHVFVKEPRLLEGFLEYCVEKEGSTTNAKVVYNTLLECYLRRWHKLTDENKDERKQLDQRILKLLMHSRLPNDNKMQYDVDHALVLCKMYQFEKGVIRLYEKKALYVSIIEHYMELNEHEKILETCELWSEQDPNLWVRALTYFAGKNDCEEEIKEVLGKLPGLLPPLQVCQILSNNESIPLSVCSDYVTQYLKNQQDRIHEDLSSISKLQDEIKMMRNQIDELTTSATIFQGTSCNSCFNPLELPVVHFLCSHSYHKRCLVDKIECPKCTPLYEKAKAMQENMDKSKSQHDLFFKQLRSGEDSFEVLSEYISRGVLN